MRDLFQHIQIVSSFRRHCSYRVAFYEDLGLLIGRLQDEANCETNTLLDAMICPAWSVRALSPLIDCPNVGQESK
jgi:hypothetical protein